MLVSIVSLRKFAGPLPRACQIISLVHLLQQLFEHILSISALVFNIQQMSGTHSVVLRRFNNPVSFCHTNVEPSPTLSAKISNSASTAAQTTVSCLYSVHGRLPLREPLGIRIEYRLTLAGHLFLKQFLERLFLHKSAGPSGHTAVLIGVASLVFLPFCTILELLIVSF